MKKICTTLSFGLLAGMVFGQPVIGYTPQPAFGTTFTVFAINAAGVSPGNAGANQTWNFSGVQTLGQSTGTCTNPAQTPQAAFFPTATQATTFGSGNSFIKVTNTEISAVGSYDGQSVFINSDPEKIFQFPFAYQQTFTDPWALSYSFQGVTVNRKGTTTVTYDGYGTLVTPEITLQNVTRVKLIQDSYDVIVGEEEDTIFYHQEIYSWVRDGHTSLFSVGKFQRIYEGEVIQTVESGSYRAAASLSVDEFAKAPEVSVYPNPSSGQVTIEAEGLGFVNLMSMEGKLLKGFPVSSSQTVLTLDLPAGIYVAQCVFKDGRRDTRRLVVE